MGCSWTRSIGPCSADSPGIQSKVGTSHILIMSWARLGLAELDSGTSHRSGQAVAEQGDTGRAGANEEANALTSASGPFMSLGFLSEGQKSVLHCIRTSGRDKPMRSGHLLTPGSVGLKFQVQAYGQAPGKDPLCSLCHSHTRQDMRAGGRERTFISMIYAFLSWYYCVMRAEASQPSHPFIKS